MLFEVWTGNLTDGGIPLGSPLRQAYHIRYFWLIGCCSRVKVRAEDNRCVALDRLIVAPYLIPQGSTRGHEMKAPENEDKTEVLLKKSEQNRKI